MHHRPLLALIVLLGFSALVPRAQADPIGIRTNRYNVPAGAVETRETWVLAQTAEIRGHYRDDLFLLAQSANRSTNATVLLGGFFSNSVWAIGHSIRLSGHVADHARLLAADALSLEGSIANGVMAAAPRLFIAPSASLEGSAWFAGSEIMVNGRIHGPTRIYGQSITLAGSFGDSVTLVAARDLTLIPGTSIHGDLFYTAPGELILDPKVHVGGRVVRVFPAPPPPHFLWTTLLLEVTAFLGAFLAGILFANFFPTFNARSLQTLETTPWKSLGIGAAAFLILPAAAFAFLLLSLSLPLAFLSAGLWLALLYLAQFIVALAVGRLILRSVQPQANVFWTLLLGLGIVWTLSNLPPPVGWLVWLGVALFGLGSMTITLLDRRIPVIVSPPPVPGASPGNTPPPADPKVG